jgi:hypothetical protein
MHRITKDLKLILFWGQQRKVQTIIGINKICYSNHLGILNKKLKNHKIVHP